MSFRTHRECESVSEVDRQPRLPFFENQRNKYIFSKPSHRGVECFCAAQFVFAKKIFTRGERGMG